MTAKIPENIWARIAAFTAIQSPLCIPVSTDAAAAASRIPASTTDASAAAYAAAARRGASRVCMRRLRKRRRYIVVGFSIRRLQHLVMKSSSASAVAMERSGRSSRRVADAPEPRGVAIDSATGVECR